MQALPSMLSRARFRGARRPRMLVALVLTLAWAAAGGALCAPPAVAALPSTGDGGWLWQAPQPQGNFVNGVAYSSATTCWEVGNGGTILRSRDDGLTWAVVKSPTTKVLRGIAFGDTSHGWAVGDSGTVIATTDGGTTWAAQDPNLTGDLAGKDLQRVDFSDAQHGCIALYMGVDKTSDGGATWTPDEFGFSATMADVSCPDSLHTYLVGNAGGCVVSTLNGWTNSSLDWPGTGDLSGVGFADDSIGWAAGDGTIIGTTDSGASWQSQLPTQDPNYPLTLNDLACYPNDTGHALAAGVYGATWSTTDGETWVDRGANDHISHVMSVAALDRKHAWVAGYDGAILATSDVGATWRTQRTETYPDTLRAITFRRGDALHGWAVGDNTAVYTTDGGADWLAADTPAGSFGLDAVAFPSATHGWAVGGDGEAFESTDGGQSWSSHPIAAAGTTGLNGVAFAPDGRHGWIFGPDLILATTDGGADWAPQTPPNANPIYNGTFVSADVGWVGGAVGQVLHTTNGGQTWTARSLPSPWWGNVRMVRFADARHGWAVNDKGQVAATPDGGKHWVVQQSGVAGTLEDVGFVDATHGWIVGDGGMILASTTAGYGDFKRPTTTAYAASVKRLHKATLAYRVTDAKPTCGWATVTIRIETVTGKKVKTVKTIAAGVQPVNKKLKVVFTCRLRRGSYRIVVSATDAAGHAQSKATTRTLKVT